MKNISLCFFLLILTGCYTHHETTFVVQRDTPQNPSFTVLPANHSYAQVEFANTIESCLIAAGVKVIQRPATKSVQTEEIKTKNKTTSEPAMEGKGIAVTQTFRAYEKTNADYYIETNAIAQQMRVVKTDTQEVLAILTMPKVFPIETAETQTPYTYMIKALSALGIIKQKKEP